MPRWSAWPVAAFATQGAALGPDASGRTADPVLARDRRDGVPSGACRTNWMGRICRLCGAQPATPLDTALRHSLAAFGTAGRRRQARRQRRRLSGLRPRHRTADRSPLSRLCGCALGVADHATAMQHIVVPAVHVTMNPEPHARHQTVVGIAEGGRGGLCAVARSALRRLGAKCVITTVSSQPGSPSGTTRLSSAASQACCASPS